jgi:hypothetical protein
MYKKNALGILVVGFMAGVISVVTVEGAVLRLAEDKLGVGPVAALNGEGFVVGMSMPYYKTGDAGDLLRFVEGIDGFGTTGCMVKSFYGHSANEPIMVGVICPWDNPNRPPVPNQKRTSPSDGEAEFTPEIWRRQGKEA